MEIPIKCPCCSQRLFDLETANGMGEEAIRIKCWRCKRVAVIRPKNYDRTERIAAR